MSISKTRQKLVDVARQLFAKNGLNGTTMNDIAVASGKGRRTLYTYFKRKEDVYYAVIESELERLSDKLDEVASRSACPQDKIIALIYTHLSMIRETVVRNGNLRAEFFRNIWTVEKVRKNFDEDEMELLRKVYAEEYDGTGYGIWIFRTCINGGDNTAGGLQIRPRSGRDYVVTYNDGGVKGETIVRMVTRNGRPMIAKIVRRDKGCR